MNDLLYYNRRVHLIQNVSEEEPIFADECATKRALH
jgi:hypothetical protein